LRRRKKKYGLATACIGGGQGIAMIVELAVTTEDTEEHRNREAKKRKRTS